MNTIKIKVRGTEYYQAKALFNSGVLKTGASVNLVAEPNNKFDKNAVEIFLGNGKLGYIPKDIAPKYQKLVLDGNIVRASISEAFFKPSSSFLKIMISVSYEAPQETERLRIEREREKKRQEEYEKREIERIKIEREKAQKLSEEKEKRLQEEKEKESKKDLRYFIKALIFLLVVLGVSYFMDPKY